VTRRVTPSGESWTRRRATRATTRCGDRDADRDDEDVDESDREVARLKRLTGERDVHQGGLGDEVQAEPNRDAGDRRDERLDRRNHADLSHRRAGQTNRGETLLPSRRRQPHRGADERQTGKSRTSAKTARMI